jgi:hypothetical protein
VSYTLIARYSVKEWVYNKYGGRLSEDINKKIAYRDKRNNDGKFRKSSFVWIDDRLVVMAMKIYWNIPTPLPGRKSMYGLKDHSWQALALCTYYLSK